MSVHVSALPASQLLEREPWMSSLGEADHTNSYTTLGSVHYVRYDCRFQLQYVPGGQVDIDLMHLCLFLTLKRLE